ncbi:CHAT domain-containing protein [Favolaschia claudopus]|uniref:CHAT domain-containing protein n=1 Tax=Favolaschia claudopus TaxID=2862362 RepID=A0AAV9ZJ98_9AGAR
MSALHIVITLDELHIKSLVHPHKDLPDGTKMFAQLIIEEHIWLQTLAVEPEPNGKTWKLRVECKIPVQACTFQVTFLRHSEIEGTRLIGYTTIPRDTILALAELKRCLCKITSIASSNLKADMEQACKTSEIEQSIPDSLEIWLLHERILLGCQENRGRASSMDILGDVSMKKYKSSQSIQDLNQAICAYTDALRDNPLSPLILADLGGALAERCEQLGRLQDITQAVKLLEKSVELTYDGHPQKPSRLSNLGSSLVFRFERHGDIDDLNHAITYMEAAADLTSDSHPNKASLLNNLGSFLCRRFEQLGDIDDLTRAITHLKAAVDSTTDGHPDQPLRVSNLGNSLMSRYKWFGDLDDLDQSITLYEAGLNHVLDGHPDKPMLLTNISIALLNRFQQLGDLDDLTKCITQRKAAVNLTPDGHPTKPSHVGNLGNALFERFKHLGDISDLNQSITHQQAAVDGTPDGHLNKPLLLDSLGETLCSRFSQLGDLADINQSITCRAAAVDLTSDVHLSKPQLLSNLGISLLSRFEQCGDINDLNQSVTQCQAGVNLAPDGNSQKHLLLSTLGASLARRFGRLGHLDDLNRSIAYMTAAVELIADSNSRKPSQLHNLAQCLLWRYEQHGDLDDLNMGIAYQKAAIKLTADCDPDKPNQLSSLGHSLYRRFDRFKNLDDLNQSIMQCQTSIDLTPDGHHSKAVLLSNLGHLLLASFRQIGNLDHLNHSITCLEAAGHLISNDHPDKASQLNGQGNSFRARFEELGSIDDLNQSITSLQASVDLTPDGHPEKPGALVNLSRSLGQRLHLLNDAEDFEKLLHSYASAACSSSGPASVRFDAAKRFAALAHIGHPSLSLSVYATAIGLLPELAWLGLSITDRHHHILKAGTLVRDAAAAAIAAGDPQKAVEWLEQGRSIIWGQFLGLRTPVDELKQRHPRLAERFIFLSKTLESARAETRSTNEYPTPQPTNVISRKFHEIAVQRNDLLDQIRQQPGFEHGILNISEHRCDGLILLSDLDGEVIHVPLKNFELSEAQSLAVSIVGTTGRAERLNGCREGQLIPDELLSNILSKLWINIVQPILQAIAINSPTHKPGRIWWCPTGPLVFLPIHAAGLYGKDQPFGSKLSDFVISSYTPSLSALLEGNRPRSRLQTELKLLAVAQRSANGQHDIPGTYQEMQYIQQEAHGKLSILCLDEQSATPDNVQQGMRDSRWVHFACHGSSRLTLSDIIQLELPNADLAFLSACQTATGDGELQDEAVHLTAGMLLAGYHSVIGTMWTIQDNDAPQVARDVYAHLLQTSPPDSRHAAEALHVAIQKLQKEGKSFLRWVPFVHFGV